MTRARIRYSTFSYGRIEPRASASSRTTQRAGGAPFRDSGASPIRSLLRAARREFGAATILRELLLVPAVVVIWLFCVALLS